MTITLARALDENKNVNFDWIYWKSYDLFLNISFFKVTKGLSMFFAKVRKPDGSLNGIEVHKLKNKLGTRQLPTAELLLDGTEAYRVI